jgi:hypothetical protein
MPQVDKVEEQQLKCRMNDIVKSILGLVMNSLCSKN